MLATPSRRRLAVLSSVALTAATVVLAAPAGHAAPVFTDAQTFLNPYASGYSYPYSGANDCLYNPVEGAEPDAPVVENGPAVTVSTSSTSTFSNTSIPSDTAAGSAAATGTGKGTSSSGNLSTIDLSVSASSQVTNALGTSTECARGTFAGVAFQFEFTVTQPGVLTLTTKNTGSGAYGDLDIEHQNPADNSGSEPYVDYEGYGARFDATVKVYLPAGTYSGAFEGENYRYSKASSAQSGTTTVHGEFHVAGSQTEAVSGKGKKYVALPAARSCAAHSVAPAITGKRKRAEQIKQVTFFVNDVKVKKVKNLDKGEVVTIPVADDQAADVVAEVKLAPVKKGKKGKVVTVSAGYEACA